MRAKNLSVTDVATNVTLRTALATTIPSRMPLINNLLTGVEIEAEDVDIPHPALTTITGTGWSTHDDGSLRDGIEFVLAQPLNGAALGNAIETFYDQLDAGDMRLSPNPRAGTHVHVNMTDQAFSVVQAMFTIIYCIDRLVFNWAGDDRQWCSYCNSVNVLPTNTIRSLLRDDNIDTYNIGRHTVWPNSSNDRYYGFNVSALFKYGTLEFRYFQTTTNREEMWDCVDFCQLVYAHAKKLAEECPEDAAVSSYVLETIKTSPALFMESMFVDASRILNAFTSVPQYEQYIMEAADELSLITSIDMASPDEESHDSYEAAYGEWLSDGPSPPMPQTSSRGNGRQSGGIDTTGSVAMRQLFLPDEEF